ncbi:hypothetical protein K458DRAFT_386244 [Lentithecium fluviatile CBS 122367]|uniref:Uncharacterized protein n=1 Tax=Lentithecium fluviatile CBS 122367 TaxID=1168545 RepID=A0A6G1JBA9_9PLEO|nr:hypothetical protein K458DRAFT_386244 [Lentithecium fluviatile CBS 122367]
MAYVSLGTVVMQERTKLVIFLYHSFHFATGESQSRKSCPRKSFPRRKHTFRRGKIMRAPLPEQVINTGQIRRLDFHPIQTLLDHSLLDSNAYKAQASRTFWIFESHRLKLLTLLGFRVLQDLSFSHASGFPNPTKVPTFYPPPTSCQLPPPQPQGAKMAPNKVTKATKATKKFTWATRNRTVPDDVHVLRALGLYRLVKPFTPKPRVTKSQAKRDATFAKRLECLSISPSPSPKKSTRGKTQQQLEPQQLPGMALPQGWPRATTELKREEVAPPPVAGSTVKGSSSSGVAKPPVKKQLISIMATTMLEERQWVEMCGVDPAVAVGLAHLVDLA